MARKFLKSMFVFLHILYKGMVFIWKSYKYSFADSLTRHCFKFNDKHDQLLAFISNDNSGWLKTKLRNLYHILQHFMHSTTQPRVLGSKKNDFKSIHCDIWNRYSENVKFSLQSNYCNLFCFRDLMLHKMSILTILANKMPVVSTSLSVCLISLKS